MLTETQITQLTTELQTDPSALGYAALIASGDDRTLAAMLNEIRPAISIDRATITGNEFLDAVVQSDYNALAANSDGRPWVKALAAMITINIKSANIRTIVGAIFPAGSATRNNLIALQVRPGSRAEQLFGGEISVGVDEVARALGRF